MSNINGGRRCAACKYLRRRCSDDCVLAPHFHPSNPNRFACVHKIFGASNIARMLQHLPEHKRAQAADAMAWEAYWRVQDPIYGSSSKIARLQDEIRQTQSELAMTRAQVAIHRDSLQQQNHDERNQPAYEDAKWATDDWSFRTSSKKWKGCDQSPLPDDHQIKNKLLHFYYYYYF